MGMRICRRRPFITMLTAILVCAQWLPVSALKAQPPFLCEPAPATEAQAAPASEQAAARIDWSRALADSSMKRYPNPVDLGSWGYAKALYLYGQYLVWKRTGDRKYLDYIEGWVDSHVDAEGHIDKKMDALDNMLPGNLLLALYTETRQEKYRRAAETIRHRLETYPRTSDGGLWHATTREHQLWLDGMYMSMPFLVRYGKLFNESEYANDEAAKQLLIYASHLHDPATGLLYHAYDESGKSKWADPVTHHSPEFWCRAIGWYGMALIEVLEEMPRNHPKRGQLVTLVQQLVKAFAKYQDPKAGLWYEVVDKGNRPDNWLETSSSSMYTYIIARSVQRGYVSKKSMKVACKGYRGVLTRLARDLYGTTHLSGICEGTNVGDVAFYLARKQNVDDFHGLGAFLIMNEQLSKANCR